MFTSDLNNMKKILAFLAFAAFGYTVNAQTTTSTAETEAVPAVEKSHSCAGHAHATAEQAADGVAPEAKAAGCCAAKGAGHADAAKAENGADPMAPAADHKAGGCCAGKAAAKSCHGGKAEASVTEAAPAAK